MIQQSPRNPKKPLKKLRKATLVAKKPLTRFRPRVRSRHPSHDPLRVKGAMPLLPFRSIIRFGSTTVEGDNHRLIECNSVESVRNSSSKLRMKRCFDTSGVKTAPWCQASSAKEVAEKLKYPCGKFAPVVSKSLTGSRGRGNKLHKTMQELEEFFRAKGTGVSNYIFEKYHDYVREYRLHVTKDGCFYTNRKMIKEETPDDQRWYRNDSNSVWIVETNPQFDKPSNWSAIVAECVKALTAVGLDIGACDVKVQGATDKDGKARPNPEFFVIEINSAPSFGEGTLEHYKQEIPKVLKAKAARA